MSFFVKGMDAATGFARGHFDPVSLRALWQRSNIGHMFRPTTPNGRIVGAADSVIPSMAAAPADDVVRFSTLPSSLDGVDRRVVELLRRESDNLDDIALRYGDDAERGLVRTGAESADDVALRSATGTERSVLGRVKRFADDLNRSIFVKTNQGIVEVTAQHIENFFRATKNFARWKKEIDRQYRLVMLALENEAKRVDNMIVQRYKMQQYEKAYAEKQLQESIKKLRKLVADGEQNPEVLAKVKDEVRNCMSNFKRETEFTKRAESLAQSIGYDTEKECFA